MENAFQIPDSSTFEKGREGESLACEFLESLGYQIVKRNFKLGKNGEIDIVAKDKDEYVFVEVKARKNANYSDPLFSIDFRKVKSIRRTAETFLYVNKLVDVSCRFDIITIDYSKSKPEVKHLINAIYY